MKRFVTIGLVLYSGCAAAPAQTADAAKNTLRQLSRRIRRLLLPSTERLGRSNTTSRLTTMLWCRATSYWAVVSMSRSMHRDRSCLAFSALLG